MRGTFFDVVQKFVVNVPNVTWPRQSARGLLGDEDTGNIYLALPEMNQGSVAQAVHQGAARGGLTGLPDWFGEHAMPLGMKGGPVRMVAEPGRIGARFRLIHAVSSIETDILEANAASPDLVLVNPDALEGAPLLRDALAYLNVPAEFFIEDPHCAGHLVFVLQRKHWRLMHASDFSRAQLVCTAPQASGMVQLWDPTKPLEAPIPDWRPEHAIAEDFYAGGES